MFKTHLIFSIFIISLVPIIAVLWYGLAESGSLISLNPISLEKYRKKTWKLKLELPEGGFVFRTAKVDLYLGDGEGAIASGPLPRTSDHQMEVLVHLAGSASLGYRDLKKFCDSNEEKTIRVRVRAYALTSETKKKFKCPQ